MIFPDSTVCIDPEFLPPTLNQPPPNFVKQPFFTKIVTPLFHLSRNPAT